MYIKVKASANQKKEKVEKIDNDTFVISVKEKAEKNQANKRVLELVGRELAVPQSTIQIVTGHHSPSKILFVRN